MSEVMLEVSRDVVLKLRKDLEGAMYPRVEFKGTSESAVKAMEEEANSIRKSMLYTVIGFIDTKITLPGKEN